MSEWDHVNPADADYVSLGEHPADDDGMSDRVPKFGDRIMVRTLRPPGWSHARVCAMQGEPHRPYAWIYDGGVMAPLDIIDWRWPEPGEWEADDE